MYLCTTAHYANDDDDTLFIVALSYIYINELKVNEKKTSLDTLLRLLLSQLSLFYTYESK